MKKEIISTTNAPAAVGPYSQAVKIGDFLIEENAKIVHCHIPSSGPLIQEDVVDSLKKAYEFFKTISETDGITNTGMLLSKQNSIILFFISPSTSAIITPSFVLRLFIT